METAKPVNSGQPEMPTQRLMSAEQTDALAERERKQKRLMEAVEAIEELCVKLDLNWGEWGAVIQIMNGRINGVVDGVTFQKIHDHYASQQS